MVVLPFKRLTCGQSEDRAYPILLGCVIKQNEQEVGNDMLLVSNHFCDMESYKISIYLTTSFIASMYPQPCTCDKCAV